MKFWARLGILLISTSILHAQFVEYEPLQEKNSFVLILDKSGSMSGDAIVNAKQAALNFIIGLKPGDRAGLITFSHEIDVAVPLTEDRTELNSHIKSISVGGSTKLYDALAVGWKMLSTDPSKKIIVYLTDGRDTGSNFSTSNLKSMFQGSNIYVYGIGLGTNLDIDNLGDISRATGGRFHSVSKSNSLNLASVYQDVLSSFYQAHPVKPAKRKGSLIVRSIPVDLPVSIDGVDVGITPFKIEAVEPGTKQISVLFGQDRLWKQDIEIKQDFVAIVNARQSDAHKNLWIISRPHGASVFLDGEFVGITSKEIIDTKKRRWARNAKSSIHTLKVIGLTKGRHHIEVIGFPDFNYGPEQKIAINYIMADDDVLSFDIFRNIATNGSGKKFKGVPRKEEEF